MRDEKKNPAIYHNDSITNFFTIHHYGTEEHFDYRIEMWYTGEMNPVGVPLKMGFLEFNKKNHKIYLNQPLNVDVARFIIETLKPTIDRWVEDWEKSH